MRESGSGPKGHVVDLHEVSDMPENVGFKKFLGHKLRAVHIRAGPKQHAQIFLPMKPNADCRVIFLLGGVEPREHSAMKHFIAPVMLGAYLVVTPGLALAANVHTTTGMQGQPNQTIGTPQTGNVTPGHASTVPGSAFNPGGNAGTHYAGTQPQNSNNPKSVSQYDVAGFQQSHK
jgi:hypothetical protein